MRELATSAFGPPIDEEVDAYQCAQRFGVFCSTAALWQSLSSVAAFS